MTVRSDAYKFYLNRWVCADDEDAFHSLIEYGSECSTWLCDEFTRSKSSNARRKIIDVAKEIRSAAALNLLSHAVLDSDRAVWLSALEALAYQNFGDLNQNLLNLKQVPAVASDQERCSKIDKLIDELK